MLQVLDGKETIRQSQDAFRQWKDTWFENAKKNGRVIKQKGTNTRDIMMCGKNRLAVCVAMGQSLERHIDNLKELKNKKGVDIICVDKAFSVLAKRGIIADIVVVSDAVVSYDYWAKIYRKQTKGVKLIVNATANPHWAESWLGPVYGVVCKDSIHTEKMIAPLIGVDVVIPASANVGNSLVVTATEICGYQEMLLVGFDYSWKPAENYYAFSGDSDGISNDKRSWQMNGFCRGIDNELHYMSSNLTFAARWLTNYYNGKARALPGNINIFNCSQQGILDSVPQADLMRRVEMFEYKEPDKADQDAIYVSRARTIRAKTEEDMKAIFENNVAMYADILCVPKGAIPWENQESLKSTH